MGAERAARPVNGTPGSSPVLIAGGGLAGCLLGWELFEREVPFVIAAAESPGEAWRVAAGIINPVTGKRLTKTWSVDTLLPFARASYRMREAKLGKIFYHELPVVRFIQTAAEREYLERRLRDPSFTGWLARSEHSNAIEIEGAGWLDTTGFVEASRAFFEQRRQWVGAHVAYEDIQLGERVRWQTPALGTPLECQAVVWCEGARGRDNPWFADIDFRPSRGVVLDFERPSGWPEILFNRGKWVLPAGEALLRAGATYGWEELEAGPNRSETAEIMTGVRDLFSLAATQLPAVEQFPPTAVRCGVRPATMDGRPVLGRHPEQPAMAILNGLGSKGATFGPWAAHQLADHLLGGGPLPFEVALARFS